MSSLSSATIPAVVLTTVGLCGALLLGVTLRRSSVVRSRVTIAIAAFGERVVDSSRRLAHRDRLRAGRIDTTYRRYAATTLLYVLLVALLLGALTAALISVALLSPSIRASIAGIDPAIEAALSALSTPFLVPIAVLSGILGAALGAGLTYWLRWWFPSARARNRERRIDLTFSQTVALLYALSRGGISVPEMLRTLRRNRGVYGAAADELSLAVRDMELLGADVLTAVERVGKRTPSDRFGVFCENLATVLQSGASTSEFLREQYERHQRRVETRQSMYLDWLATFAEAYVSLLVVGPLFLITIVLVMGLVSGGIMGPLFVLVYLLIPLSNAGFVVALDYFTGPLGTPGEKTNDSTADSSSGGSDADGSIGANGGDGDNGTDEDLSPAEEATIERLAIDERTRLIRSALDDPIRTILDRPVRVLFLTVPLALCWFVARAWLAWGDGALTIATLDDTVVGAGVLLLGTFALTHELRRRRIERIERAIPELLDRLASLNAVGVSIVQAFDRLGESNLGTLDVEIARINRDVAYGASVADALVRFDERVRTPGATRAVALLRNAMRASGDVAPVLGVAAEEARTRRTRKRKRRQEMATYLVIIYLSFLVFLAIVFVLVTVFMPTVPAPAALGDSGFAGGSVGLSAATKRAYIQLLFHAASIQGVASGLVAGQMANGDVADGAKHATIMLVLAYGSFLLFA
ncbi:hypothetical protein BRC86_08200 [Halobacteriales archaeon QS_3_64_16]|nr:MAG: hypothetical protein BRC86_08200 [Halobacteriales archaeon QS_3_64_16]